MAPEGKKINSNKGKWKNQKTKQNAVMGNPANQPDVDPTCPYCRERFSESRPNDVWIECQICGEWAHHACTADTDAGTNICDYCADL